jgi:hypothetical protein
MKPAAALLSLIWLSACSFPAFVVEQPTCRDGKRNGDETGIDCGLAACGVACPLGQGCNADSDCSAGSCTGGVCRAVIATCNDGVRNGDETGIDCGIIACSKPCAAGQGCNTDADCDGGKCQASICQAQSCTDGLQNADETDIDCGGNHGCARCGVGRHCGATSDCDGGLCTSGQCAAPTCKDRLQNGDETDIDCGGGTCLPCKSGLACNITQDCDGVACTKGKCQSAACGDGVLNQDETDTDCGGSCTPCADGLHCKLAADCQSRVCPKQTLRCAVPTCNDGVLNGNEPSTDCGASCPKKCQVLDVCGVGDDCATTSCVGQRCVPTAASGTVLSPVKWTVTASDTFRSSDPKYAVDGNQMTNWISGAYQAPGMWFRIDMATEQVFFSLEIDCNDPLDAAQAIDITLSNDGKFTDAPVIANFSTGQSTVITFPKAEVARYIQISLAQGKSRWWRMDEIRVKR